MFLVGLTGSIATGKSTVSTLLQSHSIPIVDADLLARDAVRPGTRAFRLILRTFGADLAIHDSSGRVTGFDRAELGRRVFGDKSKQKKLNGIVHPAVRRLMLRRVVLEWLRGRRILVLDVPLLFEGGLDRFCGLTIVVATGPEVQLQRLLERDGGRLSEEDAKARIASQWSVKEKCELADVVIENNGTKEELERRVEEVIRTYLRRSRLWTWFLWIPPVGIFFTILAYLKRWRIRKERTKKVHTS
jgi:dephospho-CoA kinase